MPKRRNSAAKARSASRAKARVAKARGPKARVAKARVAKPRVAKARVAKARVAKARVESRAKTPGASRAKARVESRAKTPGASRAKARVESRAETSGASRAGAPDAGRGGARGTNGAGAPGARSIWSGAISFGLVAVPVELYTGTRRRGVPLRMLGPHGRPLERRYVCPKDGKVVSGDEIERGYEVGEDEFVIVSDEELEALAPRGSREIALERFVPRDAIDPAWFERSYFLVPAGEQARAYRLFAETIEASGRAGIAQFVMRGHAYAVAIFADQGILRVETLRFGDELRTAKDLELPKAGKVPAARVRAMQAAINALAKDALDPAELEDDRDERMRKLAADKRKRGEDVVEVSEPTDEPSEDGKVVDLMALLKQRLAATEGGQGGGRKKAHTGGSERKRGSTNVRKRSTLQAGDA